MWDTSFVRFRIQRFRKIGGYDRSQVSSKPRWGREVLGEPVSFSRHTIRFELEFPAMPTNSKVARVIEKYELTGMGDTLEAAWTGDTGERTSLRDLADDFNKTVLEAGLRDAGTGAIDPDVQTTYEVLTGNGSVADRTRKIHELERAGLDVDDILNDFTTHQAIHTFLTKYRDAELPSAEEDIVDRKIETLERLMGRVAAVSESTVESLVNGEELTDHAYEVLIDVRMICPDCGSEYPLVDLLRDGGCDCAIHD